MSASREKKQRQDTLGQGLTQKQIQEQKEAAAKKRNTIVYTVIGVVVVVLVAALLIWNSGFFQARSTAVSVNGRNYTPTDVIYYYANARSPYQQYGSLLGYDASKSDKEQIYDADSGQTYHDYFLQQAMSALTQAAAVEDAAKADNYTLSADGKAAVDETLASMDAQLPSGYSRATYLKAVYGKYMTVARYRACLERAQLVSEYATNHQESLSYDDAAIQAYYDGHKDEMDTFNYNVCFINGVPASSTDAEGTTVEPTDAEKATAMSAAKAIADKLSSDVKAGGSFDALAAAAAEGDAKSSYNGEQSQLGSNLSSVPYKDWIYDASRKGGDVEVFESEGSGYYVVQFGSRALSEAPTADIRHILIKAESPVDDPATTDVDESTNAPTQEAMDAARAEAQRILEEFNAGDKTAESFGKLAEQYSQDGGSNTNGGLYEQVYDGRMFEGFNAWIMDPARQSGDTTLIENPQDGQQGWHVVYFQNWNDPVWKINARTSLLNADMQTWLEGLEAGYTAVQGSGIKYVG